MKLLISTPIRFQTTPDGAVWVKQKSDSYTFWTRYLAVFDSVTVLGRVHPVAAVPGGWLRTDGAGVTYAPVPDFVGPYQLMRKCFLVWQAVRAAVRDADAVLLRVPCNIGTILWISLASGRPYGVEVVADPHGMLAPGAVKDCLRPVWQWLLPYYLRRICDEAMAAAYVTRYALQRLYPPRRNIFSTSYSDVVTTYYSSINLQPQVVTDAPRIYATNQHTHTVICVGAMEMLHKAQDILIKAFALCVQRGMDLRLVLIGDGKQRKSLEVLATEVGMAGRITFAGQLASEDQITRALDSADLFALPSRAEGLPRAMIEAMARGLPCIGSDVGGIPELISSDSLFPADDAPALAAKLSEVLTDSARMARMSRENLERVTEYSDDVLRGRRNAFYRHLSSETARWNESSSPPAPAAGAFGTTAILKQLVRAIFLTIAFPLGLLSGFGRLLPAFTFCTQACSLIPGWPGDYLRGAFYRLTLRQCAADICISFGTLFSSPKAVVESKVYIGAYCVIGRAVIGERTQIASHVQILSGARQHTRDGSGNILGAGQGTFSEITVGANAWIGAAAIVMANVGARTTVGAGAVVTKDLPENVVAVGNPAKVIRSNQIASNLTAS